MGIEITYNDVTVQHVSHNVTNILPRKQSAPKHMWTLYVFIWFGTKIKLDNGNVEFWVLRYIFILYIIGDHNYWTDFGIRWINKSWDAVKSTKTILMQWQNWVVNKTMKYWLIDLNGVSTRLCLFYAERLEKCVRGFYAHGYM